jgi:hypothetical protein
MASIKIDSVVKKFPGVVALDTVSVEIASGEFFTLLGPSGCGKTTLLRTVAGFYRQDAGHISVGEQIIDDIPAYQREAGMVFQNYAVFPHMTVFENVAFGLRNRKVPDAEIRERVLRALKMARLSGYEGRTPDQLSGWAAAAGRPCPGDGDRAASIAARRTPLEPGCEAAGGHARRDSRYPAAARHHRDLRHPRSGGGSGHLRPDRRHERGANSADRDPLGGVQGPGQPLRRLLRRPDELHSHRSAGRGKRNGRRGPPLRGRCGDSRSVPRRSRCSMPVRRRSPRG